MVAPTICMPITGITERTILIMVEPFSIISASPVNTLIIAKGNSSAISQPKVAIMVIVKSDNLIASFTLSSFFAP